MNHRSGSFSKRAGDFFAGRGFYIVLILCVAVIGASAWAMLRNDTADDTLDLPVVGEIGALAEQHPPNLPTMGAPTPTPAPVATEPPADEDAFFGRHDDEVPEQPEEPEPTGDYGKESGRGSATGEPLQFIWPVSGYVAVPHAVGHLIFDRTMGDWRTHAGIDITAGLGEPVLAMARGTVERIFKDDLLGTTVILYHGNGLRSLYANLAEVPVVEEGQWVPMGTPLGAVGTTALAKSGTVHHLHLEVLEHGVQVDPLVLLPERHISE
ncbi:MAG: peptidoglycan DD-metalloendopeptidase family protein [Oscillospiraceae bacterium]|nr:peptidoglycan DD-metalloendopeptidase family protein [Oscillospiraceae bacterium]